MSSELKYDEIGYWSEVKLAILEEYATPYNRILLSHQLHPIYIDGFAGAGHHVAKGSDRIIEGSPMRALAVDPPFDFFHFVDSNEERAAELRRLSARSTRSLCIPRGLQRGSRQRGLSKNQLSRNVSEHCASLTPMDSPELGDNQDSRESKVTEIFLNFPVMDMNRNVFWRNYERRFIVK